MLVLSTKRRKLYLIKKNVHECSYLIKKKRKIKIQSQIRNSNKWVPADSVAWGQVCDLKLFILIIQSVDIIT